MGKGGTTQTQPTIPPELRPLYESSVRGVMEQQRQAPLGGFNERYPAETAQLSPTERNAIGQSYGLFNAPGVEALALQSIMGLPELAAAGPTTGQYQPSELGIDQYYNALSGPFYGQTGEDYNPGGLSSNPPQWGPFGPEPGPGPEPPPPGPGPGPGPPPPEPQPTGLTTQGAPQGTTPKSGVSFDQFLGAMGGATPSDPRMPVVPGVGGRPDTRVVPPRTTGPLGYQTLNTSPGLQDVATQGRGSLVGETPFWNSPGIQMAGRQAQGGGLLRPASGGNPLVDAVSAAKGGGTQVGNLEVADPAVRAQLEAFRLGVQPGMQNEYGLMGLGRSTALPAQMALAQSQMLTPLLQDALGREERGIERSYGATESELSRRERSSTRRADATAQQIQMLMGLGGAQTGRLQGAVGTGLQAGGVQRGVAQQGMDARYEDFLRRQGLSEQALYPQFQQTGTAGLGSVVRQSK